MTREDKEKEYILSIATIADKAAILPLMINFKNNSPYKDLPTVEEEILKTIEDSIIKDNKECIIIIANRRGTEGTEVAITSDIVYNIPIGIIVGTITKLPFNKQLQAYETVWWVEPEYRNTKVGLELYEAFEYWAINIAKVDLINTAAPEDQPQLKKYYTKKGYKPLEQLYYRIQN